MLSDEPIDDDLEALLYAQVYYGKAEEAQSPDLTETELNTHRKDQEESVNRESPLSRNWYPKTRYFENNLLENNKNDENTDTVVTNTSTDHLAEESSYSEIPIINSTEETNTDQITKDNLHPEIPIIINSTLVQSNIVTEDSENQNQRNSIQKDNDLESSDTQQHQFIKISTSTPSQDPQKNSTEVVTTVPLLNTPSESNQPQLFNNITINQYLYPTNFLERLRSSVENYPLSKRCQRDLSRLKNGVISEQEFFYNLKRRLKIQKEQQKKIKQAYLKKQKSISQGEIICLSDSDNSDIEVIEVSTISKENDKKSVTMKEKGELSLEESQNVTADDDEIIYVAPPPVPVINIDTESDSEASDKDKEGSKEDDVTIQVTNQEAATKDIQESQLDIDETSNDFLQPKSTPEGFNFALHGSDFQNTEFVRPANPAEVYETESSTSTSDFNKESSRQFCNTVKTIVFSEVEFPNQDIFDEANLETFGELITPKRGDKEKNKEKKSSPVEKSGSSKANTRITTRTSSESSSESDYDSSHAHRNLPDLSPMVDAISPPKKSKKNKKKADKTPKRKKGAVEETEPKIRSSKKKSKEKFSDKNDGIFDVDQTPTVEEQTKKLKRKSCDTVEVGEESPRKKNKKKKSRSACEVLEISTSEKTTRCSSPRKYSMSSKKLIGDEADGSSTPDESSRKKNKKKKKNIRNEDSYVENNNLVDLIQQECEDVEEGGDDSSKKKDKKKKGKESSLSKTSEDRETIEVQCEIIEDNNEVVAKEPEKLVEDSGKKKNKKRKQKESSESVIVEEASTNINQEKDLFKNVDKGAEGNNLNKSSRALETHDGDGIVEEKDASEDSSTKRKGKRKKRASSDRKSIEESNVLHVENKNTEDIRKGKNPNLEEGEIAEEEEKTIEIAEQKEKSNENNVAKSQSLEDEDIIIIEEAVPVHTIESSDSDQDEDIVALNDLELANISASKENVDQLINARDFDVDFVQSKMSDDPEKWKILPSDQYSFNISRKGPRCNKCRQIGHIAIYCPNKPSLPVCTLCGGTGHEEPRCPNKVCFTCGKPGNYSTVYCYMCVKQRRDKCNLCFITGHKTDYCPDLWRRYFLTTTEGPLKLPKKNCPILKPRNKQWCSGCASNGHLEFECDTYKWIREYPASSPNIFKYKDVYESRRREKSREATRTDRGSRKRDQVPANQDQRSTFPEKVVADKSNVAQDSVQRPELSEGSQLEIVSVENVANTEENQQRTEKNSESLNSTVEGPGGNQQFPENENTIQTSKENQPNNPPETSSEISASNFSQNKQPEGLVSAQQINQVPPSVQSPCSRRRTRQKLKRKSKINPLSMLRRPTGYTPYHSVLNPYSLLRAPPTEPSAGLFNPVPNDILANQLVDLANAVATYQNNYHNPDHNQQNFYQIQQYGYQIPSNPTPLFGPQSNTYQDIGGPIIPEPYYDIQRPQNMYGNREYLERPCTITRDPMEDRERLYFQSMENHLRDRGTFAIDPIELREGQLDIPPTENRLQEAYDRDRYGYEGDLRERLKRPSDPDSNFISLEVATPTNSENNNQISNEKTPRFCKLDANITKKFHSGSTESLKKFIYEELEKLKSLQRADPKLYKKKLNNIDHLKKIDVKTNAVHKQMYFLYKQINMFLFGVHKLCEGRKKYQYLQNFLDYRLSRVSSEKRKVLLHAYDYIFGGEHPDFNYRRYLNTMSVKSKH